METLHVTTHDYAGRGRGGEGGGVGSLMSPSLKERGSGGNFFLASFHTILNLTLPVFSHDLMTFPSHYKAAHSNGDVMSYGISTE